MGDREPITDHAFDLYTWGDQVFCVHVQDGGVCGRPEEDHAPAAER